VRGEYLFDEYLMLKSNAGMRSVSDCKTIADQMNQADQIE